MAENKVRFLRGTTAEYANAVKDNDTFYFTTDDGKLYIGDKEISGDGSITIDTELSDTSENPVQNKVVYDALNDKADKVKYGDTTINVGRKSDTAVGNYSTAEGQLTEASGFCSHSEGDQTIASEYCSHAEGSKTEANGTNSHAEGALSEANGKSSHAEGHWTYANGDYSHAGGYNTRANNECEFACGKINISHSDTLFSIGDGKIVDEEIKPHNAFEITTTGGKLHDKDIAVKDDIPISLPANGGNADTVNNHTVNSDVPENAVFTDTWRGIQDNLISDSAVDSLSANQGKVLNKKVEQNKTDILNNKNDISQLFNITNGGETVSGSSSYTINNAVDYPLLGLNLYGKSTQDGVPTPENPVEIISVGDNGFDIITKNDNHFNLLSVRDNGGEIITKQPVSAVGKAGNIVGITVAAIGKSLKYQWQFSTDKGQTWKNSSSTGNNLPTISLTISPTWNGVHLRCVITDANGNAEISNDAVIYAVSDDCEINTASITASVLPLCGIPVESGGNYTDSNGRQWICDELIYNADGTGKIIKHTGKIDSYNSETITIPYISTTGSLTTGAAIIYQLAEPQEMELTAAEMTALRQLQTYSGAANIFNSGGADMNVKFCTNKMLSECVLPITTGLQKQIDGNKPVLLFDGDVAYSADTANLFDIPSGKKLLIIIPMITITSGNYNGFGTSSVIDTASLTNEYMSFSAVGYSVSAGTKNNNGYIAVNGSKASVYFDNSSIDVGVIKVYAI